MDVEFDALQKIGCGTLFHPNRDPMSSIANRCIRLRGRQMEASTVTRLGWWRKDSRAVQD
jgi:hypothetical protein